jgi:hypothetical protein
MKNQGLALRATIILIYPDQDHPAQVTVTLDTYPYAIS